MMVCWQAIFLTCIALVTPCLNAQESLQKHPDPQMQGVVQGLSMREKPKAVWTFFPPKIPNRGNNGLSSAVVFDGIVYVGDDAGDLRAFHSSTGEEIWTYPHGQRLYSRPICDGTHVYITSSIGIVAVRCEDGGRAWTKQTTDEQKGTSDCTVWPGRTPKEGKITTVYYSTDDGQLHGIDTRSGKAKWHSSLMENVPDDPPGFDGDNARISGHASRPTGISTNGSTVIQSIFDQCRIMAFGARTGKEFWTFNTEGWVFRAASITDEEVFVASQSNKIFCLSLESGKEKWSFKANSRIESTPSVQGDRVFVPACNGNLHCLNRANGEELWKYSAGETAIYCQPVIGDDCVFFASGDGHVHAVDKESGKRVWKLKALKDSDLYCEIATDGERLFVTSRPQIDTPKGKSALIAIGY